MPVKEGWTGRVYEDFEVGAIGGADFLAVLQPITYLSATPTDTLDIHGDYRQGLAEQFMVVYPLIRKAAICATAATSPGWLSTPLSAPRKKPVQRCSHRSAMRIKRAISLAVTANPTALRKLSRAYMLAPISGAVQPPNT